MADTARAIVAQINALEEERDGYRAEVKRLNTDIKGLYLQLKKAVMGQTEMELPLDEQAVTH